METFLQTLQEKNVKIREHVPLSGCSTFRIGGPARYFLEPTTREELILCLQTVHRFGIRYLIVGKGSNLLFPDAGFDGAVILTAGVRELKLEENGIFAASGASLASAATFARDAGLTGFAFAHGIPGTVGGAIFMNAGAYGSEMANVVSSLETYRISADERKILTNQKCAFGYRTSLFAEDADLIILGASIRLAPGDRNAITAQMEELAQKRRRSQPLEYPSAGSVFKRPEGHFAGKLIEDCGLKGLRVGGAEVSMKHAGFIVNRGGATASDVCNLIEMIRSRVMRETGVELEPEIRIIPK